MGAERTGFLFIGWFMTPQPLRARTLGASSQRSLTRAVRGQMAGWLTTAAQAVSDTPSNAALQCVPAWLPLHQEMTSRFSQCS